MPRAKCSVCSRPDRAEIDAVLWAGTALRVLGKRYGTSKGTLHRHKQHLGDDPAAPPRPLRSDVTVLPPLAPGPKALLGPGMSVQQMVDLAVSTNVAVIERAREQSDDRLALWASDALVRCAVVQARLDERDSQQATSASFTDDDRRAAANRVAARLRRHPDVAQAVADDLAVLAG